MRHLAQEYGVSDYSIRMILRQAGVASAQPRLSPATVGKAQQMRSRGASVAEVARQVGIAQASVRLIIADGPPPASLS